MVSVIEHEGLAGLQRTLQYIDIGDRVLQGNVKLFKLSGKAVRDDTHQDGGGNSELEGSTRGSVSRTSPKRSRGETIDSSVENLTSTGQTNSVTTTIVGGQVVGIIDREIPQSRKRSRAGSKEDIDNLKFNVQSEQRFGDTRSGDNRSELAAAVQAAGIINRNSNRNSFKSNISKGGPSTGGPSPESNSPGPFGSNQNTIIVGGVVVSTVSTGSTTGGSGMSLGMSSSLTASNLKNLNTIHHSGVVPSSGGAVVPSSSQLGEFGGRRSSSGVFPSLGVPPYQASSTRDSMIRYPMQSSSLKIPPDLLAIYSTQQAKVLLNQLAQILTTVFPENEYDAHSVGKNLKVLQESPFSIMNYINANCLCHVQSGYGGYGGVGYAGGGLSSYALSTGGSVGVGTGSGGPEFKEAFWSTVKGCLDFRNQEVQPMSISGGPPDIDMMRDHGMMIRNTLVTPQSTFVTGSGSNMGGTTLMNSSIGGSMQKMSELGGSMQMSQQQWQQSSEAHCAAQGVSGTQSYLQQQREFEQMSLQTTQMNKNIVVYQYNPEPEEVPGLWSFFYFFHDRLHKKMIFMTFSMRSKYGGVNDSDVSDYESDKEIWGYNETSGSSDSNSSSQKRDDYYFKEGESSEEEDEIL